MPRKNRIPRRDFDRCSKMAKNRLSSAFFTFAYGQSGTDTNVFSCIVSKKVAKHAVDRNRIKRRLRSIMQDVFAKNSDHPLSVIIYAKKPALSAPFTDLQADARSFFEKARSLSDKSAARYNTAV